MAWNFDISQAPKGRPTKTTVTRKGETVEIDSYQHVRIIAAGNGGVVTASKWLPEHDRWEMFTKDCPPIAWQLWPDHPHSQPTSSEGGGV